MRTTNVGSLALPNGTTRVVLVDAMVLLSFYMTIVFAHVLPFPLYQLDPMKILVLVTVMYSTRWNSVTIAAVLPVLSFLSTGHPIFPKFLIMSMELMIFSWVMSFLIQKQSGAVMTFISAILVSKLAYYAIKAGAIGFGVLNQQLVSTELWVQLQAIILLGVIYAMIQYFQNHHQSENGKPQR